MSRIGFTICDVGPRDGLQNVERTLSPATRAQLINRLAAAGLKRIEVASFVRDDLVPNMAGADETVGLIERSADVKYAGLCMNERGYERLVNAQLDEVRFTLASSEDFNRRNQNSSIQESVAIGRRILDRARKDGIRCAIQLSVAFGCPFEGHIDPRRVLALAEAFSDADEVFFADTIGVATPLQVRKMVSSALAMGPSVGVHLHNTRNTGIANTYAALECGTAVVDTSVGGLGGCPFAPRAGGNIATEDLGYLLEAEGCDLGIDLDALISISEWLECVLGNELPGQVYRAGLFPADERVREVLRT